MSDLDAQIETGRQLERDGQEQEAIEYFRALVERYPDNPRVRFEYAGAHDFAGQEAEAIPVYREAMRLGLSDDDLPRAYVQLGSSLRNVGQHQEAVDLLTEGLSRFPAYTPPSHFPRIRVVFQRARPRCARRGARIAVDTTGSAGWLWKGDTLLHG